MTPLGEDSWKLVPGFPLDLIPHTFPCADFAWYSFAVIDHGCGYNCTLNPMSLPSESLKLEWSWGPLTHKGRNENSLKLSYLCQATQLVSGKAQADTQVSSVQFSRSVVSDSLRPHESQHARPPCPSPTPRVHSDSCPSSQ